MIKHSADGSTISSLDNFRELNKLENFLHKYRNYKLDKRLKGLTVSLFEYILSMIVLQNIVVSEELVNLARGCLQERMRIEEELQKNTLWAINCNLISISIFK